MTSRECLLSAMAGKMTDRVPVTLFICDQGHFLNQMAPEIPATNFAALQLKVVELQKQFGCDIFLRVLYGLVDPLNLIYGGLDVSQQTATWEVMTEEIRKCSMILQHSTIRTPKGTLTQDFAINEIRPGTFTYACTKHPIETEKDLEIASEVRAGYARPLARSCETLARATTRGSGRFRHYWHVEPVRPF